MPIPSGGAYRCWYWIAQKWSVTGGMLQDLGSLEVKWYWRHVTLLQDLGSLEVKWYWRHGLHPIYQWLPPARPQVAGEAGFMAGSSPKQKHKTLLLLCACYGPDETNILLQLNSFNLSFSFTYLCNYKPIHQFLVAKLPFAVLLCRCCPSSSSPI